MKKKKQIKPTLHSLDLMVQNFDSAMHDFIKLMKKNNKGVK